MPPDLFSPQLECALRLAAQAHRGQTRKGTDLPYITHPVQVAWILIRAGFTDEDLLAAALLHDVVEDCGVSLQDLRSQFSSQVVELVAAVSEQKYDELGLKRSWEDRKRDHLASLADAPLPVRALMLADKLHNLETIRLDAKAGVDIWSRFNAPRERLLSYYAQVVETCGRGAPELRLLVARCQEVLGMLWAMPPGG